MQTSPNDFSTTASRSRLAWNKKLFSQETLIAWLLVLPSLIGISLFVVIPTLRGFYLSFTDSDLLSHANFIGLQNYNRLIGDPQFWSSLRITARYVLFNIPLQTVLALALAMAMWRLTKSIFLRMVIFLPFLIPVVMVTLVWMTILQYSFGPINGFLNMVSGPDARIDFLGKDNIIASIAFINTWRYVGYTAILFFAGLQTIPHDLYEAAAIDGAGEWETFRSITLPLLRPVMVFVLITSLVGSFQVYDSVAVASVPSGGPGDASRVIYWYIVNLAFTRFQMGYAATVAVVLFIIAIAIAWINFKYFRANESDMS
jgi:multiple sugar transport system permease protein